MRLSYALLLISAILLLGCEIKVNNPGNSEKPAPGSKFRNKIELKTKDIKVLQAYLQYDSGKLVPDDNKIELQQKVKLILLIEGWKKIGDKVYPGAEEIITTSDGEMFLTSEDLFAEYPNGVKAEDAGIISLSAVINRIDKLYDYFLVSFRVWDKRGNGEIRGSYKLYLK